MTDFQQTPTTSPAVQATKSSKEQPPSKLWYKNYMVWVFVIGLPLFVVMACIWFVFYSVEIKDSTVRDDWYMDGKTLYADVSKDKLAHDMGLHGQMNLGQSVNFRLTAPANGNFVAPNELMVEISHATQLQKDRDFVVKKLADGSYGGTVNLDTTKGKYYIVVHDPANTWRLRSVLTLPTTQMIEFKPLKSFDTTS
ncbi:MULTISPECIES: FixH family protein [unclassified Moraxella]|uniref:FixH family protein n=1 Tax=unclassified Moraxella TaxID=2685852 RepID=UPI003AF4B043